MVVAPGGVCPRRVALPMTRSSIFALLLTVQAAACGAASPTQPPPFDLGSEFTLSPSEQAVARDDSLRVRFIEVTDDSRCPRDVQCVWAGEVKLRVAVQAGAQKEEERDLRESEETVVGGRTLTVVKVMPYPANAGAKIEKKAYRATFKVAPAK